MQPRFSAYLDIVRFLAALAVFLGHAGGMAWTGGLFWQLGAYGDTCVVVFFVLSGYVIAYVVDNKESNWWTYGANRIARLWSVVIPALALTFIIDYVGVRLAPQLYFGHAWFNGDDLGMRYLASFFLVHEIWHLDYAPGINQPFWSLGYEAFYYLVFGLLAFYKGKARAMIVLGACMLGGPLIVVLFPIWMAGVFAYQISKTWTLSKPVAVVLFLTGVVLLVLSPVLRSAVSVQWVGQELTGRYLEAIAFLMNLLAAHRLLDQRAPIPARISRTIKQVASTTFVLYLFHRPLIQLFSYIGPVDAGSWERRVLVIGATLVVVVLVTPLCERFQKSLRVMWLRWLTPKSAQGQVITPVPIANDLLSKR